ncbi:MAG: ATP-binding protein [Chloroflexota bacterium]
MFFDRIEEVNFLNQLLERRRPGPGQLFLLYGRRRVGKTHLLRRWAELSGIPFTYWAAEKEPAANQRRKLFAKVFQQSFRFAPILPSWQETWDAIAERIGQEKHILILDELPWAAEGDPAMLSSLQHAWDQQFKDSNLIIALSGSQVRAMERLQFHQSPLFGRLTGQWHLQPLPFETLIEFFPNWSIEERIALYAIVGGIPAYFEWLDPKFSLVKNIKNVILNNGSMFLGEPMMLLYDEIREPQSFLAILKAIGSGAHTLKEISNEAMIGSGQLSSYLKRLQELRFVERRLPATVPNNKRRLSKSGRYHISDPYFRFYFRFIAPFHEVLPFNTDPVLTQIETHLRAFVGATAFEALCREYLRRFCKREKSETQPERIGSHWSRRVQIDVVAINWHEKQLYLGECKWGGTATKLSQLRELVEEKTPKLIQDMDIDVNQWSIQYLFFSRSGFTSACDSFAHMNRMHLVDLQAFEKMFQIND